MRRNILVIDDDPDILELVGLILQQAGFVISSAKDGFAAFEELDKNHFDLIIMDITMPHINGFQLLKSIRTSKVHKALPIIMLTARHDKNDFMRVKDEVSDYLIKPPLRQDLLCRVERVLGGRPQFESVDFSPTDTTAQGELFVRIRLLSLSNNGMVLLSPLEVPKGAMISALNIAIVKELDLTQAEWRVLDCTPTQDGFEYFISFFGINREDQEKIRHWIVTRSFQDKNKIAA